jgi:hypothetical protein
MTQPSSNDTGQVPALHGNLHELADAVRHADYLSAESKSALADLVDELSSSIQTETLSAAQQTHLADNLDQLTQALRRRDDESLLRGARARLEKAALRAEAEAPALTDILHRLLVTLTDLGI